MLQWKAPNFALNFKFHRFSWDEEFKSKLYQNAPKRTLYPIDMLQSYKVLITASQQEWNFYAIFFLYTIVTLKYISL